jgi:hypothetical protein
MLMLGLFHFQEYLEDGIDWTPMEFVDNTNCLSLFEKVCIIFSCNPVIWIIYSLFLWSLISFKA